MDTGGKLLKSRLGAVGFIAAAVVTGMGSLLGLAGVPAGAVTSHALATSGLGYTPLSSPVRIADTRAGATDPSTYAGKTLGAGTSLTVDVPTADIPATASAVVVNVTAINPAQSGYLTVYPGGGTNPGTANITFTEGQTVGNLVTVGLGSDPSSSSTQSFTVYNGPSMGGGSVDFTADLEGYYAPATATSGGVYNALTPTRLYDSRANSGQTGANTTLTNGGSDNVTVVGVGGVPATAKAVVLNVAVTNVTQPGYITAYPAGSPPSPPTASQNFVAGETLSSQVIAGVGANGQVTIANYQGNADIVVDVDGYFTAPGGTGSLLTVLATPQRLLDTRPSGVGPGSSENATVQGLGNTAGVLSIADVYTTTTGGNYLTAYPEGGAVPLASNVNYTAGDTYNVVENSAYATTAPGGGISIYNGPPNAATTNIVVDEFGYFTPKPNTVIVVSTLASITANGTSTSSVAAAVSGPTGAGVGGDTVTFTVSPATCGTVSPTSELTNSAGATPEVTYTSSTTPGICTVTGTESATGASSNTQIDQTAAAGSALVITASPETVPDNGTTSTLTITAAGPDASGEVVTLTGVSSTTGTPNSCGAFASSVTLGTSGATLGTATTTYTSSDVVGSCTIIASAAASSTTGTTVIAQTPVASTYAESISANPAAVSANSTSTSSVTAGVTDNGAGLSGDVITFTAGQPSVTSGSATSCGTLASPTETTGATGITPSDTYTASNVVGTCTITAKDADGGTVAATVITQQASANTGVIITALPGSIVANGTSTSTLTVTVVVNGVGVSGDVVTLTGLPSATGGCGSFPASVTTGTGGTVTATYTSNTVVDTCTIEATGPADTGGNGTVAISQTPIASTYAESISANPTNVTANGTSTSSVTAGVTDNGAGLSGDVVTFTAGEPSVAGSCGTLASPTETTGATGITPSDTYTASAVVGTCTIVGKDADGGTVAAVVITQQASANTGVVITALPGSIAANGTSTSTLTVTVVVNGVGVSGDVVTLSGIPSATGGCGSFPASVTTGTGGTVTATYTSNTVVDTCTIEAIGPAGTGGNGTVSIAQTPVSNVFNEEIVATPDVVTANGSATSSIEVGVTENSAALGGDVVTFTKVPSVTGSCGTLTSPETTASNGLTPADTYTASSTVGTCTITATEADGGVAASVVITQQASVTSEVELTATPEDVTANGTSTSTLGVATSTGGVGESGETVTLTGTPSATGACGTFPASVVTGTGGAVTATYTSSTTVGTCTILATGPAGFGTASVSISQTAPVNVYDAAIQATPSTLTADGVSTSSVQFGVTKNGAALDEDTVTFTKVASVTGACGTLSSTTETTAADGITPSDTYTASNVLGTCTITGTEADGGAAASVVITQTAPVASKVNVSASPSSFTLAGQNSTVTITTVSATGVAVPGQAIALSLSGNGLLGGCGTLNVSAGTTNTSGVLTVTYTTPNLVGIIGIGLLATCTVTATDTSVTPNISGSTNITETLDILP